jgi:CshA-type fibril repeat protein
LPPTDGNPYTQVGTVTLVPASVRLCGDTQTGQGLTPCTLTSLVVSGQGTYSVNTTTGAITFTPEAGFQGTPVSPPRYMVCNQIGGTWTAGGQDVTAQVQPTCATATVTPTIGAPSALAVTDDASHSGWDQTQVIAVLTNDRTDAMLALTATSVKLCNPATTPPQAAPGCTATRLDVANVGTYTVNPDGTVSFDPLPGFSGTVATPVAYQVTDSLGRIAGATITPTVDPPTAPSAGDEQKLLLPGATVAFTTITGNSGLATGQGLQTSGASATCLITPGSSPATCDADGVVTIAGEGTYTLNPATGVVTFTAAPGAPAGPLTPITYRVTDVTGQHDTGTLTPVLVGAPIADPEASTGAYNTPQVIDVLTGDVAASGATLVPTSVKLCDPNATPTAEAPPNCTATSLEVAGQGVYTVNPATGAVTFTPVATFTGTATAAVYQVTDSVGQVASSLITPTVSDPAPPTAGPATHLVAVGIAQPFPAITGGSGLASGPAALTASSTCLMDPATSNCVTTVNMPGEGTWVLNPATGVATFTADPGATPGTLTPITYRVTDVLGHTATSTLTPTLIGPPAAADDSATTPAGTPVSVSPLGNDQANALTTLAPATVALCGVNPAQAPPACTQTTLDVPGEGTYSVYPLTGQVTFTPAPGFVGVATPMPYQVQDALGQVASAVITITVTPPLVLPPVITPAPAPPAAPLAVVPAPIAMPDSESTGKGQPVTLPVLLNDAGSGTAPFVPSSVLIRDPASGRYQSQVTIPGEGTFQTNADGTITFTPDPGFVGVTRTLPYRVTDVTGRTTSSTVQVTVHENPPPWADPDFAQGPTGHPLVLSPLGNDESGPSPFDPTSLRLVTPDGKLVTRLVVRGEGAYVVDPATGKVTFTPVRGFTGRGTPVPYRVRTMANEPVNSTITVYITAPGPALQISTRASRPVLRVGQKTNITLTIANHGGATAKSTVTRAAIPRGFSVANPMGGVVRGGYIYFRTGHLKAGGSTTRHFVLVASTGARGTQDVDGRSQGSNVGPVNDPVALRVIAPAGKKGQPVTG